VNAEVLRTIFSLMTGTPAGSMFCYNMAWNQLITAVDNNGGVANAYPLCSLTGTTGKCNVFTQTALTGGRGAQSFLQNLIGTFTNSNTDPYNIIDEVKGSIIVPPGGLLSIAGSAELEPIELSRPHLCGKKPPYRRVIIGFAYDGV